MANEEQDLIIQVHLNSFENFFFFVIMLDMIYEIHMVIH